MPLRGVLQDTLEPVLDNLKPDLGPYGAGNEALRQCVARGAPQCIGQPIEEEVFGEDLGLVVDLVVPSAFELAVFEQFLDTFRAAVGASAWLEGCNTFREILYAKTVRCQ